jgi:hypothetical protein
MVDGRNRIGGVMVSMLTSSVVDLGFKLRSGKTKYYKICIYCFSAIFVRSNKEKEQRLVSSESE